MFLILAIYNKETFPNNIIFYQIRFKILPFPKKPSKIASD